MHFRIKKCDIFIDYAFILVLSLAAVFNSKQVIYLLLFSALHEIGHLTALLICKEKPYKIHRIQTNQADERKLSCHRICN